MMLTSAFFIGFTLSYLLVFCLVPERVTSVIFSQLSVTEKLLLLKTLVKVFSYLSALFITVLTVAVNKPILT